MNSKPPFPLPIKQPAQVCLSALTQILKAREETNSVGSQYNTRNISVYLLFFYIPAIKGSSRKQVTTVGRVGSENTLLECK